MSPAAPNRWSWAIALWLLAMLAGIVVVARGHYVADMSAFLPRKPSAQQQLLVDQITHGALSRTLLMGIEGGTPTDRADLSRALARELRAGEGFDLVSNGEAADFADVGTIFLRYRYLLSSTVTPERFTVDGLHRAIGASIDELSGSMGGTIKSLLTRDPTGEMLGLIGDLGDANRPLLVDGVWASRDEQRAILVAVSRADGADTDAQERLVQGVRSAFEAIARRNGVASAHLLISGAAVFAVDARAAIRTQVTRLSIAGSLGMLALLVFAFRSLRALGLCLLPVLSGALLGTAVVCLIFGSVHGITIGFGSTLIGEAVDYSIYFLIQSQPTMAAQAGIAQGTGRWLGSYWPTVRLGMLTSVCGYMALIFSGFPGLAQLGTFSIAGLVTAALVTRFVLPRFAAPLRVAFPNAAMVAAVGRAAPLLGRMARWIATLALVAVAFLAVQHRNIWNPALSGLSPVPAAAQQLDEALRADLGAPQLRYLLVVTAPDQQAALRGAEAAGEKLGRLQADGIIAGYESPSKLVPSRALQERRRAALPAPDELAHRLRAALQGLPLQAERLKPFLADVAATRDLPALVRNDLGRTNLGLSFDAMMLAGPSGVTTFIPIRQVPEAASDPGTRDSRGADIAAALEAAARAAQGTLRDTAQGDIRVTYIDMAEESSRIYAGYFDEILALSGAGFLAIVLLLGFFLRNGRCTLAVLTPLVLAVILVMAGLVAAGERLNLLHLVGLLLIVAVGSNYALFFNGAGRGRVGNGVPVGAQMAPETLQSLLLANALTTIGFGVLAFSTVPVLHALGLTVAPGAALALLLSMVFAQGRRNGG